MAKQTTDAVEIIRVVNGYVIRVPNYRGDSSVMSESRVYNDWNAAAAKVKEMLGPIED